MDIEKNVIEQSRTPNSEFESRFEWRHVKSMMWELSFLVLSACDYISLCGSEEAVELLREIFDENAFWDGEDRVFKSIDLVREQDRNSQTGAYTCNAQITDHLGVEWDVTYQISNDEMDETSFIMEAEWQLGRN